METVQLVLAHEAFGACEETRQHCTRVQRAKDVGAFLVKRILLVNIITL